MLLSQPVNIQDPHGDKNIIPQRAKFRKPRPAWALDAAAAALFCAIGGLWGCAAACPGRGAAHWADAEGTESTHRRAAGRPRVRRKGKSAAARQGRLRFLLSWGPRRWRALKGRARRRVLITNTSR